MKKVTIVLSLLLCSCAILCFAACDSTGKETIVDDSEPKDEICLVVFDSNGGNVQETQQVKKGEKITKPNNPTKIGDDEYKFIGWFVNGSEWDFNNIVSDNITLTAHWEIVEVGTKNYLPED